MKQIVGTIIILSLAGVTIALVVIFTGIYNVSAL